MDPLTQTLLNNQMQAASQPIVMPPHTPPPNIPPHLAPRAQRWATAQQMINGYQNGWQPNPIITRVINGK